MSMKVINVAKLFKLNDFNLRDEILRYISSSQGELSRLVKNYDNGVDYTDIVEFLIIDTYNFNIYSSYVGLKILLTNNQDFWAVTDNKMSVSVDEMYSNRKLYDILINIVEKKRVSEKFKLFLHRIIRSFRKKGINRNSSSVIKITNATDKKIKNLLTKLGINTTVQFDKSILGNEQTGQTEIELSRTNYFYLINSVDDPEMRKKIQDVYYEKTSSVMSDIGTIICLRNSYAKELGYDSYFDLANKKCEKSEAVYSLLESIAEKANNTAVQEIQRIKKEGLAKKADDNDIIYYHNKFQNKRLFVPSDIINKIMVIVEKYFGLQFDRSSSRDKWDKNVDVYVCKKIRSKKELGKLYLDLSFLKTKRIDSPIFIKLSDRFKIGGKNNHTEKVHLCIVGNYRSMNKRCINYDDIVHLVKEFGYVIQHMVYESYTGLMNDDNAFSNFMPQLMEHLVWDDDIVKMITKGESVEIVDHILLGKHIDPCYAIKERCVAALFDHIIHSSQTFIGIIDGILRNKKEIGRAHV